MAGLAHCIGGRIPWATSAALALLLCLSGGLRAGSSDPFDKANEAKQSVSVEGAPQGDPFAAANQASPTVPGAAQRDDPTTKTLAELITFKVAITPSEAKPGEVVKLTITGKPKDGYHAYPITQRAPNQLASQLTTLHFEANSALRPLWPVTETKPVFHKEADGEVYLEHRGEFSWSQDVLVSPDAKPGSHTLGLRIRLMVCDDNRCVGPGFYPLLEAKVEVNEGQAVALAGDVQRRLAAKPPAIQEVPLPANASAPGRAKGVPTRPVPPGTSTSTRDGGGLWGLLVSAFVGAFLMLLTPCVFPMIPITVNFFLKQSEKEHHNALVMASIYAGTIIFLLALVMILLGKVVVQLANDPWFNLLLGGALMFFALSLFGMYEIELPSGLARFTSAREGQGGYLGTVFMALTFTITSFTCTGPFLGALLGGVAGIRPPFGHLVLAALVYSATFAAPFFVLALFPSMLRKLPKSGGWLNAVKVTMGFLEVGAALKFLANTDLAWNPGNPRIFSYDAVLCAWIALSFACGLYLIGAFRLPHDDPAEHIGVLRMIFATIFFGLAVYMTPALRRETPQGFVGEGLVAFLPPSFDSSPAGSSNGGAKTSQLTWYQDYQEAWEEAKRQNKLIFIDFTGQNCTNCRANEKNVFPKPAVRDQLAKYVGVQLYTDSVPNSQLSPAEAKAQADRNSEWRDAIGNATLPYYVVFDPDRNAPFDNGKLKGQVLGSRDGLIRDIPDFLRFLEEPQQQAARRVTARAAAVPQISYRNPSK
jgi:thiol:disulfide interchange protein DsbD